MTSKEIRESYKEFFRSKGHQIVPSAPMVIKGDPTLMFTNAGMNQFKDIILGNAEIKYPRVADSQKCLRVSGKHNDLEEVGHDTYHHTMFEMLGNWSFGDYFKKEIISWAWEYLVNTLHLDPARLYATIFEGSPSEGLERDSEAAGYWAEYLPADHILEGNKHDNFWEMGDTGPCGPCSEIHIDLRPDAERAAVPGASLVNKDNPLVIEIWNLVFMQYNRKADGSLDPLPNRVIDTGMGFERLCMALQGKTSNYDTDVFQPLIQAIAHMTGTTYGADRQKDVAMRVVADHIRTIAFSITDGQLPSNAKAGYVIRRILRRAVRYAYTFLDCKEAFMYRLLPTLIATMGTAYPELVAQQELIEKVMKEEEEAFLRTLETGIRLLEKKIEELNAAGRKTLAGTDAFALYDTYGFPLDLTELILREHGMDADLKGFDAEMQKQKERARNAAAIEADDWVTLREGETAFVGYDMMECDVEILRYRRIKQKNKTLYQIVLDKTPFYAEMGGQVGDSGWLIAPDGERTEIIDTKRENNLPVHLTTKLPKDLTASFTARIDVERRIRCECNHTATHLLHEALRETLGTHVEQKGSYVDPTTLRFDFSHFQKVTDEELRQVERIVNDMIRQDLPRGEYRDTPLEQAKEMGAVALFGEKYGDKVRVISFGPSCEFCGGIHATSTGRIGFFKIISESSVAAGIRRVEALTGKHCEETLYALEDTVRDLKAMFNNAKDLKGVIEKYIQEHDAMKKEMESFRQQTVVRFANRLVERAETVNGIKVVKAVLPVEPASAKDIVFKVREAIPEKLVCVLGSTHENKPLLSIMLSDDMVKDHEMNAGKIIREAAKLIKGGGGGQPHYAQAGGKDVEGVTAAVDKAIELANL